MRRTWRPYRAWPTWLKAIAGVVFISGLGFGSDAVLFKTPHSALYNVGFAVVLTAGLLWGERTLAKGSRGAGGSGPP
jgi:hypothetical protein